MVLFLFPREVISMGNTFTIGIKNYKKVKKEFRKLQQAPEIVAKRIVSDFKSRAPGWIAEEVVSVYNINKREIKPSKSGNVSAGSIVAKGKEIKSVSLVYSGRLLTPTHFGMKPKKPYKSGNYTLTAEILKGKVKKLGVVKKITKEQRKKLGKNFRKQGSRNSPKSPNMLLHTGNKHEGGTNYIPFQRVSQRRDDLKAIKTVSMPQMVSNDVVKENIEKTLSTEMGKRIDHHMKRYMK